MFGACDTGRRPGRWAAVAAVLFAVSGAALLTAAAQQPGPPATPSVLAGAIPGPPYAGSALARDGVLGALEGNASAERGAVSAGGAADPAADVGLPRSRPVRLVIPRIGVRTSLVGLGLNADGTVETPPLRREAPAGWYRYLASPGEVGPAVLLGHVDSARDGPAVFYRLGELRPGDRIDVTRADGIVARFVVTRVVLVAKRDFPTADVYGPTTDPQLRLVTCGGSFDQVRHSYRDNVIAFARLARSRSYCCTFPPPITPTTLRRPRLAVALGRLRGAPKASPHGGTSRSERRDHPRHTGRMTGQRTQLEREWQARAYQVMNQVITVEPLVADVLAAAYAKDGRAFVRLSKQVFPRIPLEDRLKLLVTLRPGDQELEAAIQRMRTLVK